MKICTVDQCERKSTAASGLCPTHEYRRRKGLDLNAPVKVYGGPKGPCSVEGCDRDERHAGMCGAHYHRQRRGQPMHATVKPRSRTRAGCEIPGCAKTVASHGLCSTHAYQRDTGAEIGPRRSVPRGSTLAERMAFYTPEPNENGCRPWQGGINTSGYPLVSRGGSGGSFQAHRVAYMMATGENPESHEPIHHICGVSHCVEPSHLQKISRHENTAEMLERNYYLKRIAELESEVARLQALTGEGTSMSLDAHVQAPQEGRPRPE